MPVYLIIKAIYKIKASPLNNAYQKSLLKIDNVALARGWVEDPSQLPIDDIAKHINLSELVQGYVAIRWNGLIGNDIKEYVYRRNIFLESVKPCPLTAASWKLRAEIEAEQQKLTTLQ